MGWGVTTSGLYTQVEVASQLVLMLVVLLRGLPMLSGIVRQDMSKCPLADPRLRRQLPVPYQAGERPMNGVAGTVAGNCH